MDCKVPLEEQETVINIFPARVSPKAEVYTCIPAMVNKLKKLATDRPDCVEIVGETECSVTACVDRSCVKITPKRRVSDEQRKASAERLAAARGKKVPT